MMCAGKSPKNFLQARHTLKIIANLSDRLGVQQDKLAIPFVSGPYKGTWVHRDLALRLAEYCDDTCQLETAVGQAIRALADRTPAAAAPAFPAPPGRVLPCVPAAPCGGPGDGADCGSERKGHGIE